MLCLKLHVKLDTLDWLKCDRVLHIRHNFRRSHYREWIGLIHAMLWAVNALPVARPTCLKHLWGLARQLKGTFWGRHLREKEAVLPAKLLLLDREGERCHAFLCFFVISDDFSKFFLEFIFELLFVVSDWSWANVRGFDFSVKREHLTTAPLCKGGELKVLIHHRK